MDHRPASENHKNNIKPVLRRHTVDVLQKKALQNEALQNEALQNEVKPVSRTMSVDFAAIASQRVSTHIESSSESEKAHTGMTEKRKDIPLNDTILSDTEIRSLILDSNNKEMIDTFRGLSPDEQYQDINKWRIRARALCFDKDELSKFLASPVDEQKKVVSDWDRARKAMVVPGIDDYESLQSRIKKMELAQENVEDQLEGEKKYRRRKIALDQGSKEDQLEEEKRSQTELEEGQLEAEGSHLKGERESQAGLGEEQPQGEGSQLGVEEEFQAELAKMQQEYVRRPQIVEEELVEEEPDIESLRSQIMDIERQWRDIKKYFDLNDFAGKRLPEKIAILNKIGGGYNIDVEERKKTIKENAQVQKDNQREVDSHRGRYRDSEDEFLELLSSIDSQENIEFQIRISLKNVGSQLDKWIDMHHESDMTEDQTKDFEAECERRTVIFNNFFRMYCDKNAFFEENSSLKKEDIEKDYMNLTSQLNQDKKLQEYITSSQSEAWTRQAKSQLSKLAQK